MENQKFKEKGWIKEQLLKLMDKAEPDKLWLILVFARGIVKTEDLA